MHKNIKRSVSFFMSFLMFCQIGGYSGAKVSENVKSSSDLSLGQKVKAFFNTTIPGHPGETAGVCGGAGLLTAIAIALGITKPWEHRQAEVDTDSGTMSVIEPPSDSGTMSVIEPPSDSGTMSVIEPPSDSGSFSPITQLPNVKDGNGVGHSSDGSSLIGKRPERYARGGSAKGLRHVNQQDNSELRPRSKSVGYLTKSVRLDDGIDNLGYGQDFTHTGEDILQVARAGMSAVAESVSTSTTTTTQEEASRPPVVETPDSRSPSPEDIKLTEGLTVTLSENAKKKIGDFCDGVALSRAANSAARQRHDVHKTEEFIKFLAQIENKRFKSDNLSSFIESNAIRCQQLHIIQTEDPLLGVGNCPIRLQSLAAVINPFNRYLSECNFGCIDPKDQAESRDWKVFKESLLRDLMVVDDPTSPNCKLVI